MSEKINAKIAETAGQLKGCCTSLTEAAKRNRKLFKKLGIALVVVLVLGAVGHAIFTVEGVVTGVSGDTITVTNFWGSSDVVLTEPWKSSTSIQAGDRVRIVTNLQGVIIAVRDGSERGLDWNRHDDGSKGDRDSHSDRIQNEGNNCGSYNKGDNNQGRDFEGRLPDRDSSSNIKDNSQNTQNTQNAPGTSSSASVNNTATTTASPVNP